MDLSKLNWKDVSSSNIKQIAYQDGDLHIKFGNGSHYQYHEVPKEKYVELLTAHEVPEASVGQTFHRSVRGGFLHTKHT